MEPSAAWSSRGGAMIRDFELPHPRPRADGPQPRPFPTRLWRGVFARKPATPSWPSWEYPSVAKSSAARRV